MIKYIAIFTMTLNVVCQAQNYQNLKVPSVDVNGIVKDKAGNILGSIDKEGKLKDPDGSLIAHIDAFGNTVMEADGQSINKTDVEGNMMTVREKKLYNWKTFHPEAGMELCLVREKSIEGNIVATVHKRHKQYGSSALFCFLYINKLLQEKATPTQTTAAAKEPDAEQPADATNAPAASPTKTVAKKTSNVNKTSTANTKKTTTKTTPANKSTGNTKTTKATGVKTASANKATAVKKTSNTTPAKTTPAKKTTDNKKSTNAVAPTKGTSKSSAKKSSTGKDTAKKSAKKKSTQN